MQSFQPASCPRSVILRDLPSEPLFCFSPAQLQRTARTLQDGFPGLVTYAVKANPAEEVLGNLVAAGITAFDVASPEEMRAVCRICPNAALHYHNPVRSPAEIEQGIAFGALSWSVDRMAELEKLSALPEGTEIAVRLALRVEGAAYDFGSKFGAGPDGCVALLKRVAEMGLTPSLTFHPGTQCADPQAWASYIGVAADVARQAGVRLHRMNVGGGFAAHRHATAPDLLPIFDAIADATRVAFGADAPKLVCEPGRAMVAESVSLLTSVKAVDSDAGAIFLNDGVYGGLAEARDLALGRAVRVFSPKGQRRTATSRDTIVFGPTCDSIDRLPDALPLPEDITEGDYLVFDGQGAYGSALATRFNGYGVRQTVTVDRLL